MDTNTAYLEGTQVKIVLCGRGTHKPTYHLQGGDFHLLKEVPTDEPCDRCVREGRQIAEVR